MFVKDLSVRTWTCPKCDNRHNRDYNAAGNLLTEENSSRDARNLQIYLREVYIKKLDNIKGRDIYV